jgi:hypothetical protein
VPADVDRKERNVDIDDFQVIIELMHPEFQKPGTSYPIYTWFNSNMQVPKINHD